MRIGLFGAASTGKTSTAKLLAERLGMEFQPSIVRGVMEKEGLTEISEAMLEPTKRFSLQYKIMDAKSIQDQAYPHAIFDRTPIDHAAYLFLKCHEIIPDDHTDAVLGMVKRRIKNWYDILFYFPVFEEMPYKADEFRRTGRAYQYLQDATMKYIAGKVVPKIKVHRIEMGTENERAAVMEAIVRNIVKAKGLVI